jgi:hypothetical protein
MGLKQASIHISVIVVLCFVMLSGQTNGSARDGEVDIQILSDSGGGFPEIPYKSISKHGTLIIKKYLEAKRGENYSIIIGNRTAGRIGVVIAVDGRNIISGERSDLNESEAMYIVDAYGYGSYDGWRTSDDRVNRFYFTDVPDSYAMRTFGDTSAMGVIAVAVYREQRQTIQGETMRSPEEKSSEPPSESRSKDKPQGALSDEAGTGFGDEKYSPVKRVWFEPEAAAVCKTFIRYEWRDVLCRKGIIKCDHAPWNRFWDDAEYAPYPPGYTKR